MSWRILGSSTYGPDYDRLSEADRLQFADDLFGWVDDGPPRRSKRMVSGLELFEDVSPSGFLITYLVSEAQRYVAVLRVRRQL